MHDGERLLAELQAKRHEAEQRKRAGKPVEIISADRRIAVEDAGHDPYDNPGHAKPLDVERVGQTPRKPRRR